MAMTESNSAGEDVFSRLQAAMDHWMAALTESRRRLAGEIASSQDALEAARNEAAPAAEEAVDTRALQNRIAELEAELATLQEETRALEAECDRERTARVRAVAELTASPKTLAEPEAIQVEDAAPPAADRPPIVQISDIAATDGKGHKKRMGEILVDAGILTARQLQRVIREQAKDPHRRLGALVVQQGYASEDIIARVLAAQLQLPFVELDVCEVEPAAVAVVSAHIARLHHCLPLRREGALLVIAMANPLDLIAIEDIELASNCQVDPIVATPKSIEAALERFYPEE